MKIKNWKLAIVALLGIGIFTSLGTWQLLRAEYKKNLVKSFTERTLKEPVSAAKLNETDDWRFYRVKLVGTFDNQHTFLLDNKTFHGRVGYEVYTPFYAKDLPAPILVDRGFVPMSGRRSDLPGVNAIIGRVTIIGMLNVPPNYVSLGEMSDTAENSWPLRVEFINLSQIGKLLNFPLFHYVLNLEAKDPAGYGIEWQVITMSPERHTGYAVQWFALAITLLILFVVLNRDRA